MKIVLFNGPPRSGKDSVAKELDAQLKALNYRTASYKFAWAIKKPIQKMFNLSDAEYEKYFETEEKDKPQSLFFGQIPRKVLISFSEDWAKKMFGNRIFGQIAGQSLSTWEKKDIIWISDCGFQEELDGLFEYIGPKNCLIYRLNRKGTTYSGDSRNYILNSDVLQNKELDNNRQLGQVVEEILKDFETLNIIQERWSNADSRN